MMNYTKKQKRASRKMMETRKTAYIKGDMSSRMINRINSELTLIELVKAMFRSRLKRGMA